MTVLYVDLSHHDWDRVKGEFDWTAIRRATSPVVCLRATYGDPAGYNPTTRHFADIAGGAPAVYGRKRAPAHKSGARRSVVKVESQTRHSYPMAGMTLPSASSMNSRVLSSNWLLRFVSLCD